MAEGVGDDKLAREYKALSKEMAKKWIDLAKEGDHYKLAFDSTMPRFARWSPRWESGWIKPRPASHLPIGTTRRPAGRRAFRRGPSWKASSRL
jgi:hypothetical protein